MTRLILAALVAATPLWAQAEKPADPKPADKADTTFSAADANRDGTLTLDELKTHRAERVAAIRRSGEAEDPKKSFDEVEAKYTGMMSIDAFLRYDQDDDNRLTKTEFEALKDGDLPEFTEKDAEVLGDLTFIEWRTFASAQGEEFKVSSFAERMTLSRRAVRTRAGDDLRKRYALIRSNSNVRDYRDILLADGNRDGIISRAESREYWRKSYNGEFDGTLNENQTRLMGEARFSEWTSGLDSNDDGILTRDEVNNAWDAPDDDAWKKLDANSDNRLDSDEISGWEMQGEAPRTADAQPKRDAETPKKEGETPKRDSETPKGGQTPKAPGK
jgi:Ca2+-binding EF-hand superfamily protein